MNISIDELLTLLGGKEATVYILSRRIAELEAQLKALDTAPVTSPTLPTDISG
jgi:hypothetical protein